MERSGYSEQVGREAADSYVWEVPGKPVAVEIDFDVVDRIGEEIRRGTASSSRSAPEAGGILLGTATFGEKLVVHIVDFEPVPCRHGHGPSYRIDDGDRAAFEEALRRWRPGQGGSLQAIGIYRGHLREGLLLDRYDRDLIDRYFPGDSGIVLLVKPYSTRAPKAGLFFKERGVIRSDLSPREFPFRREELGGGRPATPELEDAVKLHTAAPKSNGGSHSFDPSPPPGEEEAVPTTGPGEFDGNRTAVPKRTLRLRGGWVWIPLSFVFLLVGTILGFQVALSVRGKVHDGPVRDPYALSLSATPSADSIHLRWDRSSPAIVNAKRGVLIIDEGGVKKSVDLDAGHLRNGSVIYRSASNNVSFRLEVFLKDNITVSETVDFRPIAPAPAGGGG